MRNDTCRALVINPTAAALSNYGTLLMTRGNNQEAQLLFKQAIAMDPRHEHALLNYATLAAQWGRDYSLAEALLQRAIIAHPASVIGLTNLGQLYAHILRKPVEAEALLHRALTANSFAAPALLSLGWIFEQQGEVAKARYMYRRALLADPTLRPPIHDRTALSIRIVR